MFDILATVLTGGATGILGTVLGKAFSFVDSWQKEKAADKEHARSIELYRLQAELKLEEREQEMESQMQVAGLIILVGIIYFRTENLEQQEVIIQSVIYMASSATLWWFGDRALRSKK